MNIGTLFQKAVEAHVSDLHFVEGAVPLGRLHGSLVELSGVPLSADRFTTLLHTLLSERQREALNNGLDVDASCYLGGERWRVHGYTKKTGKAFSLRRIPLHPPALDGLGLPAGVHAWTTLRHGLVLVTGPTGSGKTTTAASMIDLINKRDAKHIVTIENPIEFVHSAKRSLVSQREVGVHVDSFSSALRSALREDPDIIFVGEMRDLETIRLALQAAETGHLVISTLHTSSAAKTVSRIIDAFPPEQHLQIRTLLAETLEGIVAQELVSNRHGERSLVSEVMIATTPIRALIREGKTHHIDHVMQTSVTTGMVTRELSVRRLREQGLLVGIDAAVQ